MVARWLTLRNVAALRQSRATDWIGAFSAFTRAFRLFLQSAMLAVGAWLALQGAITSGAMIAATIVLGRALAPLEVGIAQWPMVQRALTAWRDLTDLFDASPECPAPLALPRPAAKMTVNSLTVVAPGHAAPVLAGITFSIGPGEVLGIIGRSGSGKSTLARALTGLVRPAAGEIRLDGATLAQFSDEARGQYIGYLPQTVQMLDATVAENIARMCASAEPERIVAAAQKARVHEVILNLPKGYDTPIGGSTLALSGGQMQRVALARALFGDPQILVLDEPNSALDADGSEALNAAVLQMKAAGKSVIVMTHRPTAISTCDHILVLEAGRVRAFGPRDDVLSSSLRNAPEVTRLAGGRRA